MKELTIEQKAKAYDEALKAAIAAHKDEDRHLKATLERIFPKLQESEDERIRKGLIKTLSSIGKRNWGGIDVFESISWLEKQGKKETLCDKCRKEHPSHSCQDITALGRCAVEHEQKPAEFDDANAKRMFIKALERVEEQNNKGYKLTDCDKNSWWEDFKTYCGYIEIQKPAWSEEDEKNR